GILGFSLVIALTGYLEVRGWHLFTEGGPWILGTIVILMALFFWTMLDKSLGGKHRRITIPIFFIAVALILWAFSHTLPAFNIGLNAMGQWRWLLYLIFWAAIIFILIWALMGAFTGGTGTGGGAGGGGAGGPGIFTRGWNALFGPGTGPAGPGLFSRAWNSLFGPRATTTTPPGATPPAGPRWWWPGNWFRRGPTKEDEETTGTTTEKEGEATITETAKGDKEAEKAAAAAAAVITACTDYSDSVDEVLSDLTVIEQHLVQNEGESNKKYIQKLKEKQRLLEATNQKLNFAYTNFSKAKVVETFLKYNTQCQKVSSRYSHLTKLLPAYIQTLNDIKKDIDKIQDAATKIELTNRYEEYIQDAEDIRSLLDKTYTEFLDHLKQSSELAQIKKLEKLTENIKSKKNDLTNNIADITSIISALITITEKKDKEETALKQFTKDQQPKGIISKIKELNTKITASKENIRHVLVNAMGHCNSIKLSLEDFATNAKNVLSAIKGMKAASDHAVKKVLVEIMGQFRQLRGSVRILDQEMQNQLNRETPIVEEPTAGADIEKIMKSVSDQRIVLTLLYADAKTVVKAFVHYATNKKIINLDPDSAEAQINDIMKAAKIIIQPEIKRLAQGEQTLKIAFTEIRTAIASLAEYKKQATPEELPRINAVQKNLTTYLNYEKNVKALFDSFEPIFQNYILQQVSKKTLGVKPIMDNFNAIVLAQEKLLNLLNVMPILELLRKVPTSERVPPPTSTSRRVTSERVPPPPRT
ncbi:hypothetical protein KY315_03330, partial [Candidatus Woesearchaeota archaeon]|nr:hypothetical protein [Candidatus Woesearchaeota archaeon]